MSNEYSVGSVLSVLRYPVKSMMEEELTVAHVTGGGLIGDRAYALIDKATGKIASAKNPRKSMYRSNHESRQPHPGRKQCQVAKRAHRTRVQSSAAQN